MNLFKDVMAFINHTISAFCFGLAIGGLLSENYKYAAWALFVSSTLFMIGYIAELWSN